MTAIQLLVTISVFERESEEEEDISSITISDDDEFEFVSLDDGDEDLNEEHQENLRGLNSVKEMKNSSGKSYSSGNKQVLILAYLVIMILCQKK